MQVFDSGLIGEGILHAVAAAHANLLQPDATLVLRWLWLCWIEMWNSWISFKVVGS